MGFPYINQKGCEMDNLILIEIWGWGWNSNSPKPRARMGPLVYFYVGINKRSSLKREKRISLYVVDETARLHKSFHGVRNRFRENIPLHTAYTIEDTRSEHAGELDTVYVCEYVVEYAERECAGHNR